MIGGAKITPLTIPEAMQWLEKHRQYDILEELFGAYLQAA